ncbi:MAG: NosD domain-containing protein [Candidatus Anstonellales archaeon]
MRISEFCIFLMLFSFVGAYTPIGGGVCECSNCGDCTNALNDYVDCYFEVRLGSDISSSDTCIQNLNARNKTFDCQFHSITGNLGNQTSGIIISSNETFNFTIKNCIINNFFYGIVIQDSLEINVINNNISENNYSGIVTSNISDCIFENNTLSNNAYASFFISTTESSSFVGNNISTIGNANHLNGFSVANSTYNLFRDNYIKELTNGFFLLNSHHNIIEHNLLYNSSYGGIILYTEGNTNNTIKNNTIKNATGGIYIFQNSNNNSVIGNDISDVYYAVYLNGNSNNISYNNLSEGDRIVYLYSASRNILSQNNIYIGKYGIQVHNFSSMNMIEDNTVYWNDYSIYLSDSALEGNFVINNRVFDSSYGITVRANNTIVEKNSIYNNTLEGITIVASDCNVSENEVYNNSRGLNIYNSSRIKVSGNAIYTNHNFNIQIYSSNDSLLYNNTGFDSLYSFLITSFSSRINVSENKCYNSSYCFYIVSNRNNMLFNNSANTSAYGIALYESHENVFRGNIVHDNGHSIYIRLSSNNNFYDNIVYSSDNAFILVDGSANNSFINNTAYNVTHGFSINDTKNTTIIGGSIHSAENGVYTQNSSASLSNVHFYNNTRSFYVSADDSYFLVELSNVTFDNPSGNYENYTSLSIADVVEPNTEYSINWTTTPSSLPTRFISFRNKYVKIKPEKGTVSIDSVSWHWTDDELLGGYYDENSFELWMYDGGSWSQLNGSPDVSSNTLSLTNLNPSSDYGILEYNSSCMIINYSGEHYIKKNITGALIDVPNIPGISKACILISASDVVFDCKGYSIRNSGIADSAGIIINGSLTHTYSNITISNCDISGYTYGVYLSNSNTVHSANNTIHNNTNGILLDKINRSGIFNSTYYENQEYQIHSTSGSFDNVFIKNTIYINKSGIKALKYVYQEPTGGGSNNFTDLKICHNETIGCVNWDFLSLSDSILEASNFIVAPDFVSLDSDNAPQFNKDGNITIEANCSHSVYKKDGFPSTKEEIVYNGEVVFPTHFTCANNMAQFSTVGAFSGYSMGPQPSPCVNLSDPFTYYGRVVNLSGVYFVNKNTILCMDNYTTNKSLLVINASNIYLDCNNSVLLGDRTNNADVGINVTSKNDVIISNCIVMNFSTAIEIFNSSKNILINNTATNNTENGLYVLNSSNTTIIKDFTSDNGECGLLIFYSVNTYLHNSTASSSKYGICINNSNNTYAYNLHLFNNYAGDFVSSASMPEGWYLLNASNITIDDPNGSFENYTSIDIYDLMGETGDESYSIKWMANPSNLPPNKISFANKFINISTIAGNVSIDLLSFNWLNSELFGYDERNFELWKYNSSGWTMLNNTPDTTGNRLSLTNTNPESIYGILQEIAGPQPPKKGGRREHELYIQPIEPQYAIINQPKVVQIFVKNIGDYTEYNLNLYIEPHQNFVCGNASLGRIPQGDIKNGSITIKGMEIGHFVLKAWAVSDDARAFREFNFTVLPECETDSDCSSDEYCEGGLCLKIECEHGYVEDHVCVPYECLNDADCEDIERCINHKCVQTNYTIVLIANNITVGERFNGIIYGDGIPVKGMIVVVISPDSSVERFFSGEDGSFVVPATKEGRYTFYLELLPSIKEYGYAHTKPSVGIEKPKKVEKEVTTKPTPKEECCMFNICYKIADICWYYLVLMLLVIVIIAFLIYGRISSPNKKI